MDAGAFVQVLHTVVGGSWVGREQEVVAGLSSLLKQVLAVPREPQTMRNALFRSLMPAVQCLHTCLLPLKIKSAGRLCEPLDDLDRVPDIHKTLTLPRACARQKMLLLWQAVMGLHYTPAVNSIDIRSTVPENDPYDCKFVIRAAWALWSSPSVLPQTRVAAMACFKLCLFMDWNPKRFFFDTLCPVPCDACGNRTAHGPAHTLHPKMLIKQQVWLDAMYDFVRQPYIVVEFIGLAHALTVLRQRIMVHAAGGGVALPDTTPHPLAPVLTYSFQLLMKVADTVPKSPAQTHTLARVAIELMDIIGDMPDAQFHPLGMHVLVWSARTLGLVSPLCLIKIAGLLPRSQAAEVGRAVVGTMAYPRVGLGPIPNPRLQQAAVAATAADWHWLLALMSIPGPEALQATVCTPMFAEAWARAATQGAGGNRFSQDFLFQRFSSKGVKNLLEWWMEGEDHGGRRDIHASLLKAHATMCKEWSEPRAAWASICTRARAHWTC
jgi:hypothetical protein